MLLNGQLLVDSLEISSSFEASGQTTLQAFDGNGFSLYQALPQVILSDIGIRGDRERVQKERMWVPQVG